MLPGPGWCSCTDTGHNKVCGCSGSALAAQLCCCLLLLRSLDSHTYKNSQYCPSQTPGALQQPWVSWSTSAPVCWSWRLPLCSSSHSALLYQFAMNCISVLRRRTCFAPLSWARALKNSLMTLNNDLSVFVTYERKKMLSWTERSLSFSSTFWSLPRSSWTSCLCLNSRRFHGILSIPNLCCSSALCMAGCETHGALARSLDPAALDSAELGLCMTLINTKCVAAAQKGFVVQAQPFAHC